MPYIVKDKRDGLYIGKSCAGWTLIDRKKTQLPKERIPYGMTDNRQRARVYSQINHVSSSLGVWNKEAGKNIVPEHFEVIEISF